MIGRVCYEAVVLADFAAGRLREGKRRRVAAHVSGCPRCAQALERVRGARTAMASIVEQPVPSLSPSGAARMEAALRWTRPQVPAAPVGGLAALWASLARLVEGWRRRLALGLTLGAAATAAFALWVKLHRPAPVQIARKAPAVTAPPAPVPSPAPTVAPAPAPRLLAVVTLVGGDVMLHRGNELKALDPQVELRASDTLLTRSNGRVGFQWGDGSGALVHPSSEVVLARLEPRAQELGLERGRVAVRVGSHEAGVSMRVRTPDHVVSVHGTWFVVAAEARGTTVDVLEGVVEVSSVDGGPTTRLPAPMHAFFAAGGPPADRAVPRDERSLSVREAAQLRGSSEMGLLPWDDGARDGGLAAIAGASNFVVIHTDPQAHVAVDGIVFGAGSLKVRRIQGRHLVELFRPGFATVSRWVSIGLEPGELHEALKPEPEPRPAVAPESKEEVQRIVDARRRQVSACFERALKRDPALAGTVTLRIRIGYAGQVMETAIDNDTLADPTVAECLRREAAGWSFSAARDVTVVYPFVFRAETRREEAAPHPGQGE